MCNRQLNIIKKIKKSFKTTSEKYRDISEGEQKKKQQYDRERYKNLLEDEKQKLVSYRKNIIKNRK